MGVGMIIVWKGALMRGGGRRGCQDKVPSMRRVTKNESCRDRVCGGAGEKGVKRMWAGMDGEEGARGGNL